MRERKEPEPPKETSVTTVEPSKKTTTSILRRLIELDTAWSLHIHTICQPFPRSVLKTLEISGDGRFWFPIPVALFFSPVASKSNQLGSILIGLFIGFLLDLALVGLIKYLIRRPRPVYNKGMHLTVSVDHWSFPSGHSSRVSFIAAFLYFSAASIGEALVQLTASGDEFVSRWIDSESKTIQLFILAVCLWSAATSVSRILLGRHFVFDVTAGACLGVLEALIVIKLFKF
ncbi:probable lipid phosphate phosphatase beta [Telopea speciosissima]|uniref:probable lipid phosphate phosphatase beta n=1 Tax=Telopea speciosissima TaxID=54955 RepID=UPI001CC75379|nr:probable lipid phosphate phosphatase beta [Telopea speciosissima]